MDSNQIVEEQNRNDRIMKRALICAVLFFLIGSAFAMYLAYQNVAEHIYSNILTGNGIVLAFWLLVIIFAAPFIIILLILDLGFDALKVPALVELGVIIISNLIFFMPYIVKAIKHKKE